MKTSMVSLKRHLKTFDKYKDNKLVVPRGDVNGRHYRANKMLHLLGCWGQIL